jgi:uncharacterized protein (DUF362 family)
MFKEDTKKKSYPNFSRRKFLNTVGVTTAGLFLAPTIKPTNLFARARKSNGSFVSKVAVTQATSYDRTIIKQKVQHLFESIGGISDLFTSGKKVGIKVNLTGGSSNYHMVTHPEVLRAVGELIIDSGVSASDIFVVEALWASWPSAFQNVFTNLGIGQVNLNNAAPYADFIQKSVGSNKFHYDSFTVNQILSDVDVYVSIPKLKHHYEAGFTGSIKNQIGMVPKNLYTIPSDTGSRQALHRKDGTVASNTHLPKSICDLNLARPVHLGVIDGVQNAHGGEGDWNPTYGETEDHILLAGKDPVATDSIGAYFLGLDPEAQQFKLPALEGKDRGYADNHLYMLHQKGIGTNILNEIELVGDGAGLITSTPRYLPEQVPARYQLLQNYPNPFNPSTKIRFQVPASEYVVLKIYNIMGQEIETLVEGQVSAGLHEFQWLPNGLSSGAYLLKLQAGTFTDTKKMLYQK